jgi:hypothetical protein
MQSDQAGIALETVPLTATLPALRQVATAAATGTDTPPEPVPTATEAPSTATSQPSATAAITLLPTEPVATATVTPTETLPPTAAIPPTVIPLLTTTISPTIPPESSATAVAVVDSAAVNGVPLREIAVMPADVRDNVRRIFLEGQQIGRDAHTFSKLGDSVTLTDHYLTRFDSGHYDLGPYAYLQPAIEYYRGSFARFGVATRIGLHAWSIFDPLWADKAWCLPDEHMVACEFRLNNPSVLLIKIGSNDSGAAAAFEKNLRALLEYSIGSGVIPILATKADRFEGSDDRNNQIIRQLAQEYAIPLWDYDRVAGTLPRRGLSGDDVHMTMADADDYTKPETFERGYPVSDLTALMTLFEVMSEVSAAGDA